MQILGNLVDILQREIYPAEITVDKGIIKSVKRSQKASKSALPYIIPGFIDAHVHIESSMLVPSEFARLAVVHGTVATVSDPHEIANVCGIEGVEFMMHNGSLVPLKFYFGAPSCVPATPFETSGAMLDSSQVRTLLSKPQIKYLSEMMNFPGVLSNDDEVMNKIRSAVENNKPIDGHAPGLRGEDAKKYIAANAGENSVTISTDHECFTKEEALDKLKYGMKVIIREGSAAKNFEALATLIDEYPDHIMFCSDDKHPDSLVEGHINQLCARAVAKGFDVFNVLKAACMNPVFHYRLDVGLLKPGDHADFTIVNNLKDFHVLKTYINGELVAAGGRSYIGRQTVLPVNQFNCTKKEVEEFELDKSAYLKKFPVIEALDGQLITNKKNCSDSDRDILKIVVVNRYRDAPIAKAFITNFGLAQGALASSVAHDSHNIVAVGADDESICKAVNLVIENKGGICVVKENIEMVLPLPVAGLMSLDDGYKIAELYSLIDRTAKDTGCKLSSPFMTLSFMALLVIPHIKLSDKGLFDGDKFSFF